MEKQHKNLATALNKAQAMMTGVKKDCTNPFFKNNYSSLESVFEAIRPCFASNGLSVTQLMDVLPNGRTTVTTRLLHVSGEFLDSTMLLPDIADPQKLGSSISYFKRYTLMAIAGIASASEDDDANEASITVTKTKQKPFDPIIDESVWNELDSWLNGHEDLRVKLKDMCKVKSLKTIKQSQLQAVRNYAKTYIKNKKLEEVEV